MLQCNKEINEAIERLNKKKLPQEFIQTVKDWNYSKPGSTRTSNILLKKFLADTNFRTALIRYLFLFKVKNMYSHYTRDIAFLKARTIYGSNFNNEDAELLEILDEPEEFFKVEKYLMDIKILNKDAAYNRNSIMKHKQMLMGVIFLMIKHKIFRPNYQDKNGKMHKLTEKKIIKILEKRYKLKRLDRMYKEKNYLIQIAESRINPFGHINLN